MKEYYMKIKELTLRLSKEGYNVTSRMIKHYIDIEILQKPYYTHKNQALYADFHYVRLKRILVDKKLGKTIGNIKEDIFKEKLAFEKKIIDNNAILNNNIDPKLLFGCVEKEEAKIIKSTLSEEKTYTKIEALEMLDCESSIFDLAIDTGMIEDKEIYNNYDMYVLICVRNLISVKKNYSTTNGHLIERIGEMSKIASISGEVCSLLLSEEYNDWIYRYLIDAIITSKLQKVNKTYEKGNDFN